MKISDLKWLDGLKDSEVFTQMLSPEMLDDPESDINPVLQLGAAMLLDKPILIVEMCGVKTPENLRKVAAKIVVWENASQVADEIKEWMVSNGQIDSDDSV